MAIKKDKFLLIALGLAISSPWIYGGFKINDYISKHGFDEQPIKPVLEKDQIVEVKNVDGCEVKKHNILHNFETPTGSHGISEEIFYTAKCGSSETETITKIKTVGGKFSHSEYSYEIIKPKKKKP